MSFEPHSFDYQTWVGDWQRDLTRIGWVECYGDRAYSAVREEMRLERDPMLAAWIARGAKPLVELK